MTEFNIQSLLAPISWPQFIEDYWQHKPLRVNTNQPGRFDSLVGIDDVDFLVATNGGQDDFPISVVGSHMDHGVDESDRSSDRRHWTIEHVYARLAKGATIRIGNMPRYQASIARLAAVFEAALSTDISINLYLTPARARAFEAHYDNHDVFIIQVAGRKRWRIYPQAQQWPVEVVHRGRIDWNRRALPGEKNAQPPVSPTESELLHDWVIHPGEVLYIPRGYVHQVCTLDDAHSLHLTVAAPVLTWYEVLVHSLMSVYHRSPELRQALPPDFINNPQAANSHLPNVLKALDQQLSQADLKASIRELGLRYVNSRQGDWQGMAADILQTDKVDLDTPLHIPESLIYTLRKDPTQILLLFNGRHVPIPIRCESMLNHVLENKHFIARNLPTQLSDQSRLIFARSLLEQGFLRLAPQ